MIGSSATNILEGVGFHETGFYGGIPVSMAGGGEAYIKSYDTTFDGESG